MPPELIDLDAQATTPLAPEALTAMLPFLEGTHWNPHSAHRGGRQARAALEAARVEVAGLLDADPAGLLFTSGATEANNLALKGVLGHRPGRLLTFQTEHSCVRETAQALAADSHPVDLLPVRPNGLPDLDRYGQALATGDVALVSAMLVNNEIGSIWPVRRMAALAREAGALFHTDAAQAAGKIDLAGLGADLVSLSAHKMHGPKGIGALWVRPGLTLQPLFHGGGQEGGVRSGTQAPALAAGFAVAARLARTGLIANRAAVEARRDAALRLLAAAPHRIHGPDPRGPDRWPGNLSVSFPGVDSARLIAGLPGLALSSGAACSSGSGRPSHVLAALGLDAATIRSTLRLGWTAMLPMDDLEAGIGQLVSAVQARQARAA